MPVIAPFRGIRYNENRVGPMGLLIGPARDVVTLDEQTYFHNLHAYNFVRLIHAKPNGKDPYETSAELLSLWQKEDCLSRDPEPAIYIYQLEYFLDFLNTTLTRTGFISLMRLEDYDSGMVKPHELTFSSVKEERLRSMDSCQANLSNIFTFYDDPQLEVMNHLMAAAGPEPEWNFQDPEGMIHRIWRVTDPEAIRHAASLTQDRPFYIADGHHRYETALAYRAHCRQRHPNAPEDAPFNYTLNYAVAMQDHGMYLMAFHRMVRDIPDFDEMAFLEKAKEYFTIEPTELDPYSVPDCRKLRAMVRSCREEGHRCLGFVSTQSQYFRLFHLKDEALRNLGVSPALTSLDAYILEEVIYAKCLGLSKEDRDDPNAFLYDHTTQNVAAKVKSGEAAMGFIVNRTRIEQVKAVADEKLIMPRKSSNFYPKVAAGLVISPIHPEETVGLPTQIAKAC